MRATFRALNDIERDLKVNWLRFAEKMAIGDIGIGEMAKVVYHGIKGFGDTRSVMTDEPGKLTVDDVGEAILISGMNDVSAAVIQFIQIGFHGTKSAGKPDAPTETAA